VLNDYQSHRMIQPGHFTVGARADAASVAVLEQDRRGISGARQELVQSFAVRNLDKSIFHKLGSS
jgi:hypothetical protein